MEDRQWATSSELSQLYGCGRDRMEALLDELGLRREGDDGGTRYDAGQVERLLAERDERIMRSAAEAIDFIEDTPLATEVLRRAFSEIEMAWLQSRATGDVVDILRRQLVSHLPKLVAVQRAQSGTGGPTELEVMRRFEEIIVTALRERPGQQPSPGRAKRADASRKD
jgi:hypothetical protein